MDQAGANAPAGDLLEVPARLAQPDAAQRHIADAELAPDEMVEGYAARHDVAPTVAGAELDLVVGAQRVEGSFFD